MNKTLKHVAVLVLMALTTLAQTLNAQQKKPAVVVWNGDYELMSFYVEDEPELSINGGSVTIQADGTYKYWYSEYEYWEMSYEFSFALEKDYSLTLEDRSYAGTSDAEDALGIEALKGETKARPAFEVKDGQLVVRGLQGKAAVSVCDLGGKALGSATAAADGTVQVALPAARGTVIVKAGDVSFKIMVK